MAIMIIKFKENGEKALEKRGYSDIVYINKDVYYCTPPSYDTNELDIQVICDSILRPGKLIFRYGAMGASKTADLLMVAFNYEEKGRDVLVVKSGVDTRDGKLTIRSRIGLARECITLEHLLSLDPGSLLPYSVILCDEAQFASKEQIDFLSKIVDFLGITVICFGLRTDFQGKLFSGSQRLLAIADEIDELKTICWCGRKATCNARYSEQGIIRDGEQVFMGSNSSYVSVCRKHFLTGQLWPSEKKINFKR